MKTHRFDAISFISGLVIALLGLVFLIPETPLDIVDALTDLGSWFWPTALLIIGIAVLIPAIMPRREEASAALNGEPTETNEVDGV
jgi:hypothetical protein